MAFDSKKSYDEPVAVIHISNWRTSCQKTQYVNLPTRFQWCWRSQLTSWPAPCRLTGKTQARSQIAFRFTSFLRGMSLPSGHHLHWLDRIHGLSIPDRTKGKSALTQTWLHLCIKRHLQRRLVVLLALQFVWLERTGHVDLAHPANHQLPQLECWSHTC